MLDKRPTRRTFLQRGGVVFTDDGVLTPPWLAIAVVGDIAKAYPDDPFSIEAYTKGQTNTGDMITADNVESVKSVVKQAKYKQVKDMSRQLEMVPTTTDYRRLSPCEALKIALRNQNQERARVNEKKMWSRTPECPRVLATRFPIRSWNSSYSPGSRPVGGRTMPAYTR